MEKQSEVIQPEFIHLAIGLEQQVATTHKWCEVIAERLATLYQFSSQKVESKPQEPSPDPTRDMVSRMRIQLMELVSANNKLEQMANHCQKII